MTIYEGFANWTSVASDFAGEQWSWSEISDEQALKAIPEPDEVLIAAYEQEGYEGYAWVVYRNGEKYFTVDGDHCSCYGLEGQWNPEEYPDAATLLAALRKGTWDDDYGVKGKHIAIVTRILSERAAAPQPAPPLNHQSGVAVCGTSL